MKMSKASKPERRYAKRAAPGMAQTLGVGLSARLLRYGHVVDRKPCGHEIIEFPMEIDTQEGAQ